MSTTFTNTGNFTGNLTGTGTNSANTNTGMATGTGTGSWANSTHSVIWMSRSGKEAFLYINQILSLLYHLVFRIQIAEPLLCKIQVLTPCIHLCQNTTCQTIFISIQFF